MEKVVEREGKEEKAAGVEGETRSLVDLPLPTSLLVEFPACGVRTLQCTSRWEQ